MSETLLCRAYLQKDLAHFLCLLFQGLQLVCTVQNKDGVLPAITEESLYQTPLRDGLSRAF